MSVEEVARIASALPEVTEGERYGHRTWQVAGKAFAWDRPFSKADIKRFGDATPPDGPILAVRVADEDDKKAVLAAEPKAFFTIPHFDGYSAVLIHLKSVTKLALREAVIDAWLACAPTKLADDYVTQEPSAAHLDEFLDDSAGDRGRAVGENERGADEMSQTISYKWRGDLSDAEMVDLVESHGGNAALGWWDQIRTHSLGWVSARDSAGLLVGFVNVAWDGSDHAFLIDTKTRLSYQRSGIGSELVRRAAQAAKAAGCDWLHVDFEARLGPFYFDACGFSPVEAAGLIPLPSLSDAD